MATGNLDLVNATTKRRTTVPSTIKRTSDLTSGLILWQCCYRNYNVHQMSLNLSLL